MDPILETSAMGPQWQCVDPFLFCAHHDDAYPAGQPDYGPARSELAGRRIGMDFGRKDGWSMYHGDVVPGFPVHPHRGFETVTLVRKGLLDHADSLGAAARFGGGDVQWLTAGKGIQHSEMFPLLNADDGNPLELFQIWLNLPRASKMVEPYFSMLWQHTIPEVTVADAAGRETTVTVVAGEYGGKSGPPGPPNSWASDPKSDLAMWTIRMAPGAQWELPAAKPGTNRTLYFFEGSALTLAGRAIAPYHRVRVQADAEVHLEAGPDEVQLLLLQGAPISEPVARRGPFVMNTPQEIQQAFSDYRRTRFGGWPWDRDDPVHGGDKIRFARHPDGRTETPT